jgi:serine phosphatase RsbU (regulator of sigma subunit)
MGDYRNEPMPSARVSKSESFSPHAEFVTADAWMSAAGDAHDGGDWCETGALPGANIALSIGDVAGHGAAVAARKRAIRGAIVHAMHRMRIPSDVLAIANGTAHSDGSEAIVTAIVAFIDVASRTLTFANAGHPPPLLVTAGNARFLTRLHADVPLGVFATHGAADIELELPAEVLVVFYTDGVTERERDPIAGERDLIAAARAAYERPQAPAANAIAGHVFADCRGTDDAAILTIRTGARHVRHRRT